MKIIIVGIGKVGYILAKNLATEQHDVTVIDTREETIQKVDDTLDVLSVRGNGASIHVLQDAQVEKADIVIATTQRDEINMLCCFIAKKLGAAYTIARIRDHDYEADVGLFRKMLSLDMCINPEKETAVEISKLLRFPDVVEIDTFYGGQVELVGFLAGEEDIVTGMTAAEAMQLRPLKNSAILFSAIRRGGETIIPRGDTKILPGDIVHVIGKTADINRFFKTIGRLSPRIKDVMVVGGSRIARYLAEILDGINMHIKMIEINYDKCIELSEALPYADIVCGDGTEEGLLESEGIGGMDSFVSLTGRDEDNLIVGLYAAHQGVGKVVAKIDRRNYYELTKSLNMENVVNPIIITVYGILKTVRGMENSQGSRMIALYPIQGTEAEAMEFAIEADTAGTGVPLKDMNLKPGILIGAILRKGDIRIPEGTDHFEAGDHIIIISTNRTVLHFKDIFGDRQ